MIRVLAALLFSAWLTASASAASLAGVTIPDTYATDGQTLVLNGTGLRTYSVFGVKIYVAGLYLAKPSHDAAQIMSSPTAKVIQLHFLHAGSKADVEKQYRAGEAVNCGSGGCDQNDQADFERLVAAAPAVAVGDISTYIFTPKGVRVLANGRVIGDFTNRDLANHLLAGFIGDHPPSEDLRKGLLGTP